jgi:hypothetical protein
MGNVGDFERITRDYLVTLFKDKLGYTYPGNWEAPITIATWRNRF